MSQKQMKRLRKSLKEAGRFDIHTPADYRVSNKVKRVKYFKEKNELGVVETVARTVEMVSIVNITKLPYRRLKKAIKQQVRGY